LGRTILEFRHSNLYEIGCYPIADIIHGPSDEEDSSNNHEEEMAELTSKIGFSVEPVVKKRQPDSEKKAPYGLQYVTKKVSFFIFKI
jgi:hypothetical protein